MPDSKYKGKGLKLIGNVNLEMDGRDYAYPLLEGTEGERSFDISQLRDQTGAITLDEGYVNTGSCLSAITYIDGEKGILRYRGYPIEELAERSNFLETSYLVIYGKLPRKGELEEFTRAVSKSMVLEEKLRSFSNGFPVSGHPMAVLASFVAALSTFFQEFKDPQDNRHIELAVHRLLGKLPLAMAYGFKRTVGQPFVEPDPSLDYAANFLHMMFSVPSGKYKVDPVLARALDTLFVIHADHEQSCSTSTVRLVGTSGANMYASVSAAISALWGHFHGGANQAVIEMLQHIEEEGSNPAKYVESVKQKKGGLRLMGFGHRVYRNFDPRATIIKRICDDVLKRTKQRSSLFEIAQKLERIALSDPYFIERKLYPNVDFYTGIIYLALGIPINMFTVLFAMGRLPGWIAQWQEMKQSGSKIGRPRQIYTGETLRHFTPLEKR